METKNEFESNIIYSEYIKETLKDTKWYDFIELRDPWWTKYFGFV